MAYSHVKRVESWLRAADVALLVGWLVVATFFPAQLKSTHGYVAAVAWYIGIIAVGGQNALYLHPRYRILISMGLALGFATVLGIFWGGSGWSWYMEGGLLSVIVLGVAGTVERFVIAHFLQHPAIQLVPCRLAAVYHPLLEELGRQPHVFVEAPLVDPAGPLPERRAGYPIYLVVTDLHLREADFAALMPLYTRAEIVDISDLYETLLGKLAIIPTPEGWILPQALRMPSPIREMTKRIIDTLVVLLSAPVVLPLVGLAALAIRLTSRGPMFFTQERLGRYGEPFRILKLRTMRTDAEVAGPQWAGVDDPRVTPVGRLLRATGIDELPQLWNVLQGEMSLVGPRPERPEWVLRLEGEIPFYRARLLVAPGLTGWAQLHQGGDVTVQDVAEKLRYDLYYLKYASPALDLRILLGTAQMLLHLAKPKPKLAPPTPPVGASGQ